MAKLKYDQQGARGRGYFPQLKGLGDKLATFQPTGVASAGPRSADDVAERRSKQAAKLARRAARCAS